MVDAGSRPARRAAEVFATCCALRLARFNTELEVPDRPR